MVYLLSRFRYGSDDLYVAGLPATDQVRCSICLESASRRLVPDTIEHTRNRKGSVPPRYGEGPRLRFEAGAFDKGKAVTDGDAQA